MMVASKTLAVAVTIVDLLDENIFSKEEKGTYVISIMLFHFGTHDVYQDNMLSVPIGIEYLILSTYIVQLVIFSIISTYWGSVKDGEEEGNQCLEKERTLELSEVEVLVASGKNE